MYRASKTKGSLLERISQARAKYLELKDSPTASQSEIDRAYNSWMGLYREGCRILSLPVLKKLAQDESPSNSLRLKLSKRISQLERKKENILRKDRQTLRRA